MGTFGRNRVNIPSICTQTSLLAGLAWWFGLVVNAFASHTTTSRDRSRSAMSRRRLAPASAQEGKLC